MPYSYQLTVPIIPYRTARYWGSLTFTHDSRESELSCRHTHSSLSGPAPPQPRTALGRWTEEGPHPIADPPPPAMYRLNVPYGTCTTLNHHRLSCILFALPTDRSTRR